MNPEFQRNLWLEAAPHRLVAMPAVLVLIFLATWLGGGRTAFPVAAEVTIGILLIIWGSRLAADSVLSEVAARTWDAQRMSALSPWDMTWGKLFGSTIYVWYGAAWCLVVFAVGRGPVMELLRLLLSGLEAQALAFLISLLLLRRGQGVRFQLTIAQLLAILAVLTPHLLLPLVPGGVISWYGVAVSQPTFMILTQAMFLGWTILGLYRLIRVELQYPSLQPTWAAFVVTTVIYFAGFDTVLLVGNSGNLPGLIVARLLVAFCAAIALTYLAAFIEPKSMIGLQQWLHLVQQRRLGRVVGLLPAWIPSFVIALSIAAGMVVDLLLIAPPTASAKDSIVPFIAAVLLFCTRDIAMLYALVLRERSRRGHLNTIIYLIALYFVGPVVLSTAKLDSLMPVLVPSASAPPELVVLPVLAEAVVAVIIAMQRWNAIRVIESERNATGYA